MRNSFSIQKIYCIRIFFLKMPTEIHRGAILRQSLRLHGMISSNIIKNIIILQTV